MTSIQFANGDQMPSIGLGTWKATGDEVKYAVKKAIKAGYRHIDTAAVYQNEEAIGEELAEIFAEGTIRRKDMFITSKLWNNAHLIEDVLPALKESLRKLQLDYLDLYLMHWPVAFKPEAFFASNHSEYIALKDCPISDTWNEMQRGKQQGLVKHLGVSNFNIRKLGDLISKTAVPPEVNQVELHPLLQQNKLWSYCKEKQIVLTAYSPLGSGDRSSGMKGDDEPNLMQIPSIINIARKHNCSAAQILLAWHLHRGCSVIPKSTNAGRIKSNFEAAYVTLDKDDMQSIARLDMNYRYITGKFFDAPEKGYKNIFEE